MSSLATEPNVAGVHARVAEVFASEDARRAAWLDWLVKKGGTCRGCGAGVHDTGLRVHPGVCASCLKRGVRALVPPRGLKPLQTSPPKHHAAPPRAQPAEEVVMPKGVRSGGPCPGCGTKSTNCRGDCPERQKRKGKAAGPAAPPRRVAVARPERIVGPFQARGRPVEELFAIIDACSAEVRRHRDEAAELVRRADAVLGGLAKGSPERAA